MNAVLRNPGIGDNSGAVPPELIADVNPPEQTPFELSKTAIEDLFVEAKNWLDGTPITCQAEADAVGKLLADTRLAAALGETRRKAEAEPFDTGKAEVQARYNPLIQPKKGLTEKIETGCKAAIAKWLIVVENEKRAIAATARAEADEKARLAQEAFATTDVTNIEGRIQAEELLAEAKSAEKWASKASKDRASVAGGARAVSLRTTYTPVLQDAVAALEHYYAKNPAAFDELVTRLAQVDVDRGLRTIPGFEIVEGKTAQ